MIITRENVHFLVVEMENRWSNKISKESITLINY